MAASDQLLKCPKCKAVLAAESFNLAEFQPCHSCEAPLQLEVFPALFREETTVMPERVMLEGEASCFYHPGKKAVVVCDGCGRFLCALCDVDFDGQRVCPSCLQSGQKKGRIKKLQNERVRHDSIALILALLPMLIFYFTLITAPVAVYYSIRHWNSPGSIVRHRSKLNFSLAITLAGLQILGWITFFVFLARR